MGSDDLSHSTALWRLRVHWAALGILGLFALFGLGLGLGRSLDLPRRWQLQSTLIWTTLWLLGYGGVARHRSKRTGVLLKDLGTGNVFSLLRAWLIAILAGYLFGPRPAGVSGWLPALAFTLSYVADQFDGYFARRQGSQSDFGEALDMELDGLGVLVAVSLAVGYRTLPVAFLPMGLARYIFTLFLGIRRRLGLPVTDLAPSRSRRPIAGLTRGFLSAALWPILTRPEATVAGIPFYAALASSFTRDALVAACIISPSSSWYQRLRRGLRKMFLEYLPIMVRLLLLLFAFGGLPRLLNPPQEVLSSFSARGFQPAGFWVSAFAIAMLTLSLPILIGLAGRFAAFLYTFPLGLTITAVGLDPWLMMGLLAIIAVLFLGCGLGSIWQPSDRLLGRWADEVEGTRPVGSS